MADTDLKSRLQSDLTEAIRGRDEIRSATLRMALTAVRSEEVAGTTARTLSDDEVLTVLAKEAKKRREAAEAYLGAGRQELADREGAELIVLERYLPQQLSDDEISRIVADAITQTGAEGPRALGQVMKIVQPKTKGRADGGRVAAEVRRQLDG